MDIKTYSDAMDIDHARILRERATEAERCVWNRLRNRQIQGLKFRRQHPVGGYILDFACEEIKLAIELDGSQHNEKEMLDADAKRTEFLSRLGWRVLRFWNNDVMQNIDGVFAAIEDVVNLGSR
jgi:very-short-patch-repair endonuclease